MYFPYSAVYLHLRFSHLGRQCFAKNFREDFVEIFPKVLVLLLRRNFYIDKNKIHFDHFYWCMDYGNSFSEDLISVECIALPNKCAVYSINTLKHNQRLVLTKVRSELK